MTSRFLIPFLLTFAVSAASAAISLPKNLSESDRETMLQILGFGSQAKLLSSPVPLGGKQGFEVGLSSEYIPIEDLSGLGDKPDVKGEYNYLMLTFGKGLFYNLDTFFHLTPIPQSEGLFAYGAQLRWGFYEFQRFPGLFSMILHGSGANYANVLNTRTTGADLVMTVAIDEASLYFGTGIIRTVGTFAGGPEGITAEGTRQDADLSDVHTVFGLSLNFGPVFLALEVDRVTQSVYGGRLGYRF